jgi:hypothetical protein
MLQLPKELRKGGLCGVLHTFWTSRRALLGVLPHFFSVVAELEGPTGLSEAGRALRDTGKWFP